MSLPFRPRLACGPLVCLLSRCGLTGHRRYRSLPQWKGSPNSETNFWVGDSPVNRQLYDYPISKTRLTSAEILRLAVVFSAKHPCSHLTCPENSPASGGGSLCPKMCILGLVNFQSEIKVSPEVMKERKHLTSKPLFGYPEPHRILINITNFLELRHKLRMLNPIQSFYNQNQDIKTRTWRWWTRLAIEGFIHALFANLIWAQAWRYTEWHFQFHLLESRLNYFINLAGASARKTSSYLINALHVTCFQRIQETVFTQYIRSHVRFETCTIMRRWFSNRQ